MPECTLEQLLEARDRRRLRQEAHFASCPGTTLVVATVVAPGPVKVSGRTMKVAAAQRKALRDTFAGSVAGIEEMDPISGHETWLTTDLTPEDAKRLAVDIEETHPLGRLFDIDVIVPGPRPLSRGELGYAPRRCLLCSNEARLCMRLGKHTRQEVADYIDSLVDSYEP